jgi:hypothetical protein
MPDPALPQALAPPAPAVWHGADRWTGTDSWAVAHPRNIRVVWGQPRTRQLVVKLRTAVAQPV